MTTIRKGNQILTVINVFTVEAAKQRELVALLAEATEKLIRHARGFISTNIHRSLDGTKVTNYAQWSSANDYQAMLADPAAKEHMARAIAIAKIEPGTYEVAETCSI